MILALSIALAVLLLVRTITRAIHHPTPSLDDHGQAYHVRNRYQRERDAP